MLPFLSLITIAQLGVPLPGLPTSSPSPTVAPPQKILVPQENIPPQERLQPQETLPFEEVFQPQEIRPLPGQLDSVPVFNSNSPEVVQTEGILLSTFPPQAKLFPSAHLNFPFQGRFDIFSHHIARARTSTETRTLFQGVMLYNPTLQPIAIEILQGASYLTHPDALFVNLPSYVDDPRGTVYAGPGSRVMNDLLRGRRQGNWPALLNIPSGQAQMLMNLPIPVGTTVPSANGRSTLLRLWSSGPVYIASLAMFAPLNPDGSERIPALDDWKNLLVNGNLAGPRDLPPTPVQQLQNFARITYGRVAGVAVGSQWQATLTDSPKSTDLSIPRRGRAFSYGISTLYRGTLGTGQVQSAKLLVRYPDTAYLANGNYGVQYSLTLPLANQTGDRQTVVVSLQTPLKEDKVNGGLLFFKPPGERVFFRGPVRLRYLDDQGVTQTRYVHVTQQRGQQGEPLVVLNMAVGDRRLVQVDLLYPPDSTPPQVLTIKTLRSQN
jgi:hypothetical protein